MADNALTTVTYSTNTAALSHPVTLSSALTVRSLLAVMVSYDGNSGSQVSSITDTDGNTWISATNLKKSSGAGVNGEFWYTYNVAGGTTPTITVTLASSLKCSIAFGEYGGIVSWGNPFENSVGRIHTPGAPQTSRSSGAMGLRITPIGVFLGGMAWNSASQTTVGGVNNWTPDSTSFNASSGLGASLAHKTSELAGISAGNANAQSNFTLSPSSVAPVAIVAAYFSREGIFGVGADFQDASIQDMAGVLTVVQSGDMLVTMQSVLAPNELTKASAHWLIDTTQFGAIPVGLLFHSGTFEYFVSGDTFDDGAFYTFKLHLSATNTEGTQIDASDEGLPVDATPVDLGLTPLIPGKQTTPIEAAKINRSGMTPVRMEMVYLAADGTTSSYSNISDNNSGALPAYFRLVGSWPDQRFGASPTQLMMGGL